MKRVCCWALALLLCMMCSISAAAVSTEIPTQMPSEAYCDLAEHWAPTIYQDVNDTYLTRADIPTALTTTATGGVTTIGRTWRIIPGAFGVFLRSGNADALLYRI